MVVNGKVTGQMSDFYLLRKCGFGTEEKQWHTVTKVDHINGIIKINVYTQISVDTKLCLHPILSSVTIMVLKCAF